MSETCFPDCASAGFKSRCPYAPVTFAEMVSGTVERRCARQPVPPGPEDFPPLESRATQTSPILPPPPQPPSSHTTATIATTPSRKRRDYTRRKNASMVSTSKQAGQSYCRCWGDFIFQTRRQWSLNVRAVQVLLCPPCWKQFRDDDARLPTSDDSQIIVIKPCSQCVRHNRALRFDYSSL